MSGPLNHSPADIVRHLLKNEGYGTLPEEREDWPLNISMEPDKPDNCITLYDTQGRDFGFTAPDRERQVMEGIQIKVRAIDHPTGFTKANALAIAIDRISEEVLMIDATQYIIHRIRRTSDVLVLGQEKPQSNRHLFTINAVVSLRIKP